MIRTHVDLFTGIGGFALAAQANGVQTIAMCEIDDNCRAFLSRAWPEVEEIHDDVRTFDAVRYSGAWLLTAGAPCQPTSRAGKQRGSDDGRWLWPQAIRVLSAVRPTWALFENPPGIGDVGLAGVLADMEGEGYEVRVFSIPACAVGAAHRRERYWIIGHRGVGQADAYEPGCERPDVRKNGRHAAAHGLRAEHRESMADAVPLRWHTGGAQNPADAKAQGHAMRLTDYCGTASFGSIAQTASFVERLMTLSAWLMGYTAAYLQHWATASSRRSRKGLSKQ